MDVLEEVTVKKEMGTKQLFCLVCLGVCLGNEANAFDLSHSRPSMGPLAQTDDHRYVSRGPAIGSMPLRATGFSVQESSTRRSPDVVSSQGNGLVGRNIAMIKEMTYFSFTANGQPYHFRADLNGLKPDLYVLPMAFGSHRVLATVTGDPDHPVYFEFARPETAKDVEKELPASRIEAVDRDQLVEARRGAKSSF